jgi:hypothetical protein
MSTLSLMLEPELGFSSDKVLIIYLIIPKNPPVTPKTITPIADIISGVIYNTYPYSFLWGIYFSDSEK